MHTYVYVIYLHCCCVFASDLTTYPYPMLLITSERSALVRELARGYTLFKVGVYAHTRTTILRLTPPHPTKVPPANSLRAPAVSMSTFLT